MIKFYVESDEQKIREEADQQAKRLADIIALKCEMKVVYHYAGTSKKIIGSNPERWTVCKTSVSRSHTRKLLGVLDLTDKSIAPRLMNDYDLTLRLHHFATALGADELQPYAYMFTELFQVIEDDKNKNSIPDYRKYDALRNGPSHRELDPKRAIAQVNRWFSPPNDFEFTAINEFDHNSDKNERQLQSEANNLKQHAMSYLNSRI